jgi:hypothetical protein
VAPSNGPSFPCETPPIFPTAVAISCRRRDKIGGNGVRFPNHSEIRTVDYFPSKHPMASRRSFRSQRMSFLVGKLRCVGTPTAVSNLRVSTMCVAKRHIDEAGADEEPWSRREGHDGSPLLVCFHLRISLRCKSSN